MFIWSSGGGILTIPIAIVCGFVVLPIVPPHDPGLLWPAYTDILSGVVIYFVGRHWNTDKEPIPKNDTIVKTKTQYKRVAHNTHTLYSIPMQYIGIIFVILGIGLIILSALK